MRFYIYFLLISCLLISCYTYKPISENQESVPQETKAQAEIDVMKAKMSEEVANTKSSRVNGANRASGKNNKKATPKAEGIKGKLEADKIYKIEVGGKRYKVKVEQWENDSLVVHRTNSPKAKIKFHKNQIKEESILEKRFSQPISDIITVGVYAGIAVAVIMLIK